MAALDEHYFDLTANELVRVASVLTAIGDTIDWPTLYTDETGAHAALYRDLSPEQQQVYDMLNEQGVLG